MQDILIHILYSIVRILRYCFNTEMDVSRFSHTEFLNITKVRYFFNFKTEYFVMHSPFRKIVIALITTKNKEENKT